MKKEKNRARAKVIGIGEAGNARSRNTMKFNVRIQDPQN